MAEIAVELDEAKSGFPAVCAMTGGVADGAIPVRVERSLLRWGSPTVRIPMCQTAFRKWSLAQSVMVKVRIVSIVLVVVALGLSVRNPLGALVALVLAGVAMAISVRAEHKVQDLQPGIERSGNTITLVGIHPAFVRAVTDSR